MGENFNSQAVFCCLQKVVWNHRLSVMIYLEGSQPECLRIATSWFNIEPAAKRHCKISMLTLSNLTHRHWEYHGNITYAIICSCWMGGHMLAPMTSNFYWEWPKQSNKLRLSLFIFLYKRYYILCAFLCMYITYIDIYIIYMNLICTPSGVPSLF